MRGQNNIFMSESGKVLVMDPDVFKREPYLHSPDGITYYVVYGGAGCRQTSGDEIKESGSFHVPTLGVEGQFERHNETLTWLDETYIKTSEVFDRSSVELVQLPDLRQLEYLVISEDGSVVIYVSASFYEYSYKSFRLFIGDGETMREVKVQDVIRYRDGGTTYIETDEGTFYSPAPKRNASSGRLESQPCIWNEEIVLNRRVMRDEVTDLYNIAEDETGLVTSVTMK